MTAILEKEMTKQEVPTVNEFVPAELKLIIESRYKSEYPGKMIVVKVISNHYFRVNVMEVLENKDCLIKTHKFLKSEMVKAIQNGIDVELEIK